MNDPGFSFGYKVQFSAPIVRLPATQLGGLRPGADSKDQARAALENMDLDLMKMPLISQYKMEMWKL